MDEPERTYLTQLAQWLDERAANNRRLTLAEIRQMAFNLRLLLGGGTAGGDLTAELEHWFQRTEKKRKVPAPGSGSLNQNVTGDVTGNVQ